MPFSCKYFILYSLLFSLFFSLTAQEDEGQLSAYEQQQLAYAHEAFEQGNYEQAEIFLTPLIQKFPNNSEIKQLYAELLVFKDIDENFDRDDFDSTPPEINEETVTITPTPPVALNNSIVENTDAQDNNDLSNFLFKLDYGLLKTTEILENQNLNSITGELEYYFPFFNNKTGINALYSILVPPQTGQTVTISDIGQNNLQPYLQRFLLFISLRNELLPSNEVAMESKLNFGTDIIISKLYQEQQILTNTIPFFSARLYLRDPTLARIDNNVFTRNFFATFFVSQSISFNQLLNIAPITEWSLGLEGQILNLILGVKYSQSYFTQPSATIAVTGFSFTLGLAY